MEDFLKFLKFIGWCILLGPMVAGLLMIATGNGTSSTDSSYHSSRPYNRYQNNLRRENEHRQKMLELERQKQYQQNIHSVPTATYPTINVSSASSSETPDDAYSNGYDQGYEDGRRDGINGRSHGYGYDDSSDYYNHYETRYQEGYEEGYDDGYSSGSSEYEEENEYEW